jgi:tetratricopeptide (TPR) repeat protein
MDESLAEADLSKLYDAALDEFEAHRHKNALPLFEKLLELEHGVLPTEVRIHVREALGKCCFNLRRYGDAAKYYREALATLETSTSFGATHDKTMHVRYKLARALSAVSKLHLTFMRNLREAVALHEKNLDIIKSKGNSTLYKETMHNSASILCKLTKYDKAEPIYKELLEAKRIKSRGLTDRESLELKHEYASVLYHLKRYEDSKQLFLQIQGILLPLSHSRNRKLDELGQSVDKYLAACIEATNDINLGAARAMKSAAERRPQAMPKPTVYSEMRATTAPVVPSRNRPHQRQDENSTTTASPISAKPNHQQNSSQNNGRLTACELNDQTPSRSRESSRAAPGLDVPQALVATARRAKSDQSLSTVSKIVSRQHPVARPKSTQPSQTTKNDDNGTPSTSVHARSSLQPSTVDNGAWPPSSRSTSSGTARNPNISVASTSRSPSHTQSSESQTVIPKPVRNRRQFPGMLPQTTISVPVVHSSPTPETSSAAKSQTPGA